MLRVSPQCRSTQSWLLISPHLPGLPLLDFPSHQNHAPALSASAKVPLLPARGPCAASTTEEVSLAPNAGVFVALSLVVANSSPPATYNLDGFAFHIKNNNKKIIQYWCNRWRNKKGDCKAEVCFLKNKVTGLVDNSDPNMLGTVHTFKCCKTNGVDTNTYHYLGKMDLSNDNDNDNDLKKGQEGDGCKVQCQLVGTVQAPGWGNGMEESITAGTWGHNFDCN